MQLKEYLNKYREYSGKASDSSRQLAFAAIAVIWVFKNPAGSTPILPSKLVLAAFFMVLSLGCDLFQYIAGSLIWKIFHRIKEKQGVKADADVKASPWLSNLIWVFFFAKIVFLIVGYILILTFLWGRFYCGAR
jgi:hypothetical protein